MEVLGRQLAGGRRGPVIPALLISTSSSGLGFELLAAAASTESSLVTSSGRYCAPEVARRLLAALGVPGADVDGVAGCDQLARGFIAEALLPR